MKMACDFLSLIMLGLGLAQALSNLARVESLAEVLDKSGSHETTKRGRVMKANLLVGILMLAFVSCNEKAKDEAEKGAAKTSEAQTQDQAIEDFERQNLAGEIDGQAFTFITGKVSPAAEEGKSYLTLYDVNVENPCAKTEGIQRSVIAKIALEPSRIELSEENKITVSVYDGTVARSKEMKEGVIKINRVENGLVSGALLAKFDDKNYLQGSFEAEVCK